MKASGIQFGGKDGGVGQGVAVNFAGWCLGHFAFDTRIVAGLHLRITLIDVKGSCKGVFRRMLG